MMSRKEPELLRVDYRVGSDQAVSVYTNHFDLPGQRRVPCRTKPQSTNARDQGLTIARSTIGEAEAKTEADERSEFDAVGVATRSIERVDLSVRFPAC
jgi:hypothetical protein